MKLSDSCKIPFSATYLASGNERNTPEVCMKPVNPFVEFGEVIVIIHVIEEFCSNSLRLFLRERTHYDSIILKSYHICGRR